MKHNTADAKIESDTILALFCVVLRLTKHILFTIQGIDTLLGFASYSEPGYTEFIVVPTLGSSDNTTMLVPVVVRHGNETSDLGSNTSVFVFSRI